MKSILSCIVAEMCQPKRRKLTILSYSAAEKNTYTYMFVILMVMSVN